LAARRQEFALQQAKQRSLPAAIRPNEANAHASCDDEIEARKKRPAGRFALSRFVASRLLVSRFMRANDAGNIFKFDQPFRLAIRSGEIDLRCGRLSS